MPVVSALLSPLALAWAVVGALSVVLLRVALVFLSPIPGVQEWHHAQKERCRVARRKSLEEERPYREAKLVAIAERQKSRRCFVADPLP